MKNMRIVLQDNTYVDVLELDHVKAIGSDKSVDFDIEHLEELFLKEAVTYTFAGKDSTVSLCGSAIKYLLFTD